MSRKVLIEPEASSELREAALWYEAQRSSVGLALLAAVAHERRRPDYWQPRTDPLGGVLHLGATSRRGWLLAAVMSGLRRCPARRLRPGAGPDGSWRGYDDHGFWAG